MELEARQLSRPSASTKISMVIADVGSLAKKLEVLLGGLWDILFLTEVRSSRASQHAQDRRAARYGYKCIWCVPPGPSPTCSVSHGGVAIIVREPMSAIMLHPPEVMHWIQESRVVVAQVIIQSWVGVLVSVYGYAEGHAQRQANERLLADTFKYLSSLKVPAVLAGDLNVSIRCSQVLSLHWQYKLWKISDDEPTTKGRHTQESRKLALDHCLCNGAMIDCGIKVQTCRDWRLSDHYPLVGDWLISTDPILIWQWPKKVDLGDRLCEPRWEGGDTSYAAWCSVAERWIRDAYGVEVKGKNCVSVGIFKPRHVKQDIWYNRLCSIQRALAQARKHPNQN